ncbi:hypothetical protein GE061_006913 [Apolygus lucorum]|uniref:Uncharacterized protein n=1 Tax=Apolygus lucorum TaxID=248454 RepID=A0A8S9WPP4_APOLU|nr:hypothetical protein GE061_006913 [Apolygus lucorum]
MNGEPQSSSCTNEESRNGGKGDCLSEDLESNQADPVSCRKPLKIPCGTPTLILLTILGILVNCSSLLIGVKSINDCPAQDALPIYLIASGVSGLLKIPFFAYFHIRKNSSGSKTETLLKRIYHLLIAVGAGLFVMGSIAVYQDFPSFHPGDANYCDKLCYHYAFWFISCILIIGFLVISILMVAMLAGLALMCLEYFNRPVPKDQENNQK